MTKQDPISLAFTIGAVFLSIYWSTGEKSFLGVFPAILLISSFGLNYYIGQRYPTENKISGDEAANILVYAGVALAGMFFTGTFTQNYFSPQTVVQLSGLDAVTYGVLMAVAEEQFFRGALVNFLFARLGSLPAVAGSGAIFAVYHFFVYAGSQSALLYVLGGGLLLAYVTVRSGRISPAILSHVCNNILAVM